ncbi:MAG: Trm112 family protein [Chromatiales bacterium]|jgi:uncharacterized protein YbaR (Trm112 family)|nr:Trm112 family protein [Chromatiales bacterium]
MDNKLLDIVCCPLTKLPLQRLDAARLRRLNQAISAGALRRGAPGLRSEASATGEPVPPDATLTEALVTRDGRLVYPVRDGIPILLAEESIDWTQLPPEGTS